MVCNKVTAKRYRTRPGPPYHAADCKGRKLRGNDGRLYVSEADSRGVYRWTRSEASTRSSAPTTRSEASTTRSSAPKATRKNRGRRFEIIDNGGTPFVARVTSGQIEVVSEAKNKVVLKTRYQKIFIGDNNLKEPRAAPKGKYPGNSILIRVSADNYIYIGSEIYGFKSPDTIKEYYSPVGNSHVPYPYAVGDKYVYFMLDRIAVPKEQIDLTKDAYAQFYQSDMCTPKKRHMSSSFCKDASDKPLVKKTFSGVRVIAKRQ